MHVIVAIDVEMWYVMVMVGHARLIIDFVNVVSATLRCRKFLCCT